MTPNEYQDMAARTICDQKMALNRMARYNHELSETAVQLNHAVMGIGGEQGELCTALQRWIYYGREFDAINFQEELGDVLWYVAEACSALGVNMGDIMSRNISKLQVRYPDKYTDFHAAEENRDRKGERAVLEDCGPCKGGLITAEEAYRKSSTEAMKYIARQTGPRPAIPVCPKCKTILNKGYCAECCERTI